MKEQEHVRSRKGTGTRLELDSIREYLKAGLEHEQYRSRSPMFTAY